MLLSFIKIEGTKVFGIYKYIKFLVYINVLHLAGFTLFFMH